MKGNTSGVIGKLFSYIDLIFVDHGIFRFKWRSLHKISENTYRSNQPFPWQILADKNKRGVKTIINLRGIRNCSSFFLEKETCEKHNIKLINFPVTSRAAPKAETILAAKKLFNEIEYPIIMHCKSGADRAGLMSALYLILHKNVSVIEAKKQLSFKYLHIKHAKTGILDAFFDNYIKENKNKDFLDWVKNDYNPEKLTLSFKVKKLSEILSTYILRRE
ncbi:MAG: protein tyrosine phosphatase [Pelagibacterales bacterium]|nr:protein tyrosine phosphatase [Pelagibacterales bacterium]